MFQSLRLPITLGVIMIVLLVALTIGWIVITVIQERWAMLSIGTSLTVLVLAGVVVYLTMSIQTINLNRRQSNFMDAVTHELKSPIASLKLYLQTLNRRSMDVDQRANCYRVMLEDVERLDGLINHLLDAARLERQPTVEETEDVELSKLLRGCAEYVCSQYRISQDVVRLELGEAVVRGRRVDLDMIFRNLLDNAIKYAGDRPAVDVTLHVSDEQMAVVRISDNGRGIPHHLRRKIFGRFVRLGLELEREKPGTGLGLYIVRTLVRRLRGRVRIRDRDEKQSGTVFEVQFPIQDGDSGS